MHLIWISNQKLEVKENVTHEFNFDIYGRSFHFYSVEIPENRQSELFNMTQHELNQYITNTYGDLNPSLASVQK